LNKPKYGLLLKNTLWGSGSFIFISLFSFLLLPYIIKKLSIEGYGIYILITSLVGFYGILDLGLGSALIKYVAELHEKNDFERLNIYINSTVIFQGIIGLLSSSAIIFYSKNILNLLNVSKTNFTETTFALNLCALGFLFTFIGGAYRSVLQGLQLYKYTSIMDTLVNLALNLFVALILFMGYGLIGSIIINVIVAFLTFAGYYILVKINVPSYSVSLFINIKVLKDIIHFSFFIFLSKISAIFSNYIVKFIISFFLGPAAVTYYTVPSKLVGAVGGISSSGLSSIFPFSSQLNTCSNNYEIKELFLHSAKLYLMIILPIVILIVLFSKQILTIWVGKEFAERAWIVLSIIAFSSCVGSLSTIPNLIILGMGNSKLIGIFSFITITLYAVFVPTLTEIFGINGAALALLLTSLVVIYYVIAKTTKYIKSSIQEYAKIVLMPNKSIIIVILFLFPIAFVIKLWPIIISLAIGVIIILLYYLYLIKYGLIPYKRLCKSIFQ
jgi:O-antigen/teichoic acid export membrane protein